MTKTNAVQTFESIMNDIHAGMIEGYFDEMTEKLVYALNYYDKNKLSVPIINIFEKASNALEAVTKKVLLLEQLSRIVESAEVRGNYETYGSYIRYYALAQAFYGEPSRGMNIIKSAEQKLNPNTGIYIELRNAKALILAELKEYRESLEAFEINYTESVRIGYEPGFRFLHNIGTCYRDLGIYDKAAKYFDMGINYDLEAGYTSNAVTALVELSDLYFRIEAYEACQETLNRVNAFGILTQNQFLYKTYCDINYQLNKKLERFDLALKYHELLMELEFQVNVEKYTGLVRTANMERDLSEKEHENMKIKSQNTELQLMKERLENTNKFLKSTLEKSEAMQEALKAKNDELESTMKSLNLTQEKLIVAEKQTAMDQMFINIAKHMSTPLGVMNTTLTHQQKVLEELNEAFQSNKLGRHNLASAIEESKHALSILETSLDKVVGFIDTLSLYKNTDEKESQRIELKAYLEKKRDYFLHYKGAEEITLNCVGNIEININVSLLDKCIELIGSKLLQHTKRKGFDFDVSVEINILTIGIGDFKSDESASIQKGPPTLVDQYDHYIVQSIVENLLGGRFINFEDRGRDFYQFTFHLEQK
ncbi:MAG: hypothetical protein JXR88_10825 [Clostridia bacterium]|nr:hypothetical protein [Clostridia bacterium]